MLEHIYIAALIAGGGMVLVSALAGGGEGDFDADADGDLDASSDASIDVDATGFVPFFQMKFWIFFLAFFGLTGFILEKFAILWLITLPLAIVMGFLSGYGVTWALNHLKGNQRGSMVHSDQIVGREAKVKTAIRGETIGQVQIEIGGRLVEYLAISDETRRIEPGEPVVVVSVEGTRVRVMPRKQFLNTQERD